ncbi:MAG: DUF6596 domain-containing protein [Myxococcota bacterium]
MDALPTQLTQTYRDAWGIVVATLIRLTGDIHLAEDVAQDAFAAALAQWPREGTPDQPRAWLITVAKRKAINILKRQSRWEGASQDLEARLTADPIERDGSDIDDDRLRLIFTCCHPALAQEAQVALTLRTLCGLTTEEIARAFLVPLPTMAQRLVRAKHKVAAAGIPFEVPSPKERPGRLDGVMTVLYLLFNEGYAATAGAGLIRADLCAEAIRLCALVRRLMGHHAPAELSSLLALMLLHDARRDARTTDSGDVVLLEDQDRSRWNHAQIERALPLVEEGLRGGPTPYALQAAIAALHARAPNAAETDWPQIAALYGRMEEVTDSPLVSLNRAVAVAMFQGPEAGLAHMQHLSSLEDHHLFHSARAALLAKLGRTQDSIAAYRRALALASNDVEKRFLQGRLDRLLDA